MKKDITNYIKKWEARCYSNGIPDDVPVRIHQLKKAPSYKSICLSILRNDLRGLGIEPKRSRYYDILKTIELQDRGVIIQLKINFSANKKT